MNKDWIRNASDEELSAAIAEPQMVEHFVLMKAEVERRSLHKLLSSSERLHQTTLQLKSVNEVTAIDVQRLANSSVKLEGLTSTLIVETANVHRQVIVLTASSHNIERLTKWLIGLTVVLGILTLALATDVVLKYIPEHLQLTAPQTPPSAPAR